MRVTTVGNNGSAPAVAQVLEARGSRAGSTLPQITAEVTELKAALMNTIERESPGGDSATVSLAAVELMGTLRVVVMEIAQTVVQLGIDLGDITTRATLADALAWALKKAGVTVVGEV
jgi:hypothetical protein